MATTKTVTGMVTNSLRANDDGSRVIQVTVTYADASTEKLELQVIRTVP